jgi:hypothetical protein
MDKIVLHHVHNANTERFIRVCAASVIVRLPKLVHVRRFVDDSSGTR